MGLITTNTGLHFGEGLIYEDGLGGLLGLTINPNNAPVPVVVFNGTGSMSAKTIQHGLSRTTFNGTGSLSTIVSLRQSVSFVLAGVGSMGLKTALQASVTFSGSGSFPYGGTGGDLLSDTGQPIYSQGTTPILVQ